jgi:hypothetical protein
MRTQLTCNSRAALLAAAALALAFGLLAAAPASALPDLHSSGPAALGAEAQSGGVPGLGAEVVARLRSSEFDFGAVGPIGMEPLTAVEGGTGGVVLDWASAEPAFLVAASSLFPPARGSRRPLGDLLRDSVGLGVVPRGNLSVFQTGTVESISWDFLDFSCALLALRLDDYLRLGRILGVFDPDANARLAGINPLLRPVPEPATLPLVFQGILVLGLLRARGRGDAGREVCAPARLRSPRSRSGCAVCAAG